MSSSNPIQTHFVILCNRLDVERILPYLKAERMVTSEEYETLINDKISDKQKRERLLIMMPRKGSDFFKNFGNCLVWSGQTQLARHIGIEVAAIPKCPHPQDVPAADPFGRMLGLMTPGGNLPPGISHPPSSLPSTPSTGFEGHPSAHRSSAPEIENSQYLAQLRTQGMAGVHPPGYQAILPSQQYLQPTLPPAYQEGAEMQQVYRPAPPVNNREQYLPHPQEEGQLPHTIQPSDPPVGTPKVFILYYKDTLLEGTHHVSAQTFADNVLDMANILRGVGGIEVSMDMYEKRDIANWGIWTEERVQESRYVVMVCSPCLYAALRSPDEKAMMVMEKASFYAENIVNLVRSPKFVPVFLDNCQNPDWIPGSSLKVSAKYTLNLAEFAEAIHDPNGVNFHQLLGDALQMPKFDEWSRLIGHLRGDNYAVPPPAANPPIQLPQAQPPVGQVHYHNPQAPPNPYHDPPVPRPPPPENGQITEGEMLQVAQKVAQSWKNLGMRLNLDYSVLDQLGRNHPNGVSATMAMFGLWRESGREDRSTLKVALINIGYGNIANKVFAND